MSPSSFSEASVTLILKPDKENKKKKKKLEMNILMNMDANILKRILAHGIQLHIKRIIHHDHIFLLYTHTYSGNIGWWFSL